MPIRVTRYEEAFDLINVQIDDGIRKILLQLTGDDRNEKSICYAIWKEQDTLRRFRHDTRFHSVLVNCIKKWSWARDDPRWKEYTARKQEEEKATEIQKQLFKNYSYKPYNKKTTKHSGFIYFIQGQSGGAVKIGYTTDVFKRLKGLQTGHPDTLIIRCCIPGNPNDETNYHHRFASCKLKGEWFKPTDELMAHINEMNKLDIANCSGVVK
jgi:hypothetical protein